MAISSKATVYNSSVTLAAYCKSSAASARKIAREIAQVAKANGRSGANTGAKGSSGNNRSA
jgi:hypothetical protein